MRSFVKIFGYWSDFCSTALQHILGHFGRGQLILSYCSWASLLGSLPALSALSFASNWQLLFLNQRKRIAVDMFSWMFYIFTKSPRKNVPGVGIEIGAACIPSENASDRATAPGYLWKYQCYPIDFNAINRINIIQSLTSSIRFYNYEISVFDWQKQLSSQTETHYKSTCLTFFTFPCSTTGCTDLKSDTACLYPPALTSTLSYPLVYKSLVRRNSCSRALAPLKYRTVVVQFSAHTVIVAIVSCMLIW